MSYALDRNTVAVKTAEELLRATASQKNAFLVEDSYDLSAAPRVDIHGSIFSFTKSSVILPTDDIITPVLHTLIHPFDGITFDNVNFPTQVSGIRVLPQQIPKKLCYRRCCFVNMILIMSNGGLPIDPNVTADIRDVCVVGGGEITGTNFIHMARCQFFETADGMPFNPDAQMLLIIPDTAAADRGVYVSGTSLHATHVSPPAQPSQGIQLGPLFVPVQANRADMFDLNALANGSNGNAYATGLSMRLVNNTFTSPVGPPGPNPLLSANDVAADGTDVFSDTFLFAGPTSGVVGLLSEGGASSVTLGTNQLTVAERGGIVPIAYTLGSLP